MKNIEVIATFNDEGRVIPRRIRYYDEKSAEYKVRDVSDIYFEERTNDAIRYLLKLREEKDDIGVIYILKKNGWFILN